MRRSYLASLARNLCGIGLTIPFAIIACGNSDPNAGGFGGSGSAGNSGSSSGNGGSNAGNGSGSGTSTSGNGSGSGTATSGNGSGSGTATSGNGSGSGTATSGTATSGSATSGTATSGASGTQTSPEAGTSMCGTPGPDVISDFEQGTGSMIVQGGRKGYWYVYADPMSGMQTPAASGGPIAVSAAPTDDKTLMGETCNKYALHSTASGHTAYAGVGAAFIPGTGTLRSPYDVSASDGIQFDVKGAASEGAIYFEVMTQESQPANQGGTPATTNVTIDVNNNRGYLLGAAGSTPGFTSTAIPTAMTTVYVPFSLLIPRHFPQPGPNGCGSDKPCEAPAFNPLHALGFQFSVYPDAAFGNTTGNYDLWVDNVSFYKGDNGLTPPDLTAKATFKDGATGFTHCSAAIPTFAGGRKAAGKYLQWAYRNWLKHFYKGGSIQRPENGNDTVSEGIGYGMLLSVYFNDRTTFDALLSYSGSHAAVGSLMTWCLGGGGAQCNAQGGGSATDADEDMAFALIQAGKLWGGTYAAKAATMIADIAANDIDWTNLVPLGGSNYKASKLTNPSYFAPAYYRIFKGIDAGHDWVGLADKSISVISALSKSNGLVPAWCSNNCTAVAGNGANTDMIYQYDAHRVPWRVGVDYCWNGTATAQTYLKNITTFFSGLAAGGIDSIVDEYNLDGSPNTSIMPIGQPNSMSIIGSAGVGAMAGGPSAFVNSAWQFVLDGSNRAALDTSGTFYAYSYYNATLGLMTALTMSGNFYPM